MTLFKNKILSSSRNDFWLIWILRCLGVMAGAIALLIVVFLILESLQVLNHIGFTRFFTDSSWNPSAGLYNLSPMLLGTILAMGGSVLIATPIGIISAVFLQFYAPPYVAGLYRRTIELLAGIPSVVYGFWGLVVLAPLIGKIHPPGPSLLAGIAILTVMILPTVALVSHASLAKVPVSYIQGATALGLSRWATIRKVVLPAAKSGLFTGLILETGRAIGETMAILMVCGNVVQVPKSIFDPIRTLTANIALEMAYATGDHRSALFVSGLVLMGLITLLVGVAEVISQGKIYQ
ncbi:phosphate ABC transporter, permease protein PstC [Calothrix sp. NIES-4071]|nr:phosphate ABC transporter, permease protein PstC [Calothrix sp. NIES-4071]BAZ56997.1 phosphate ABC transporter, permease protein PstC [Calothrix sp. NIES-4105]